MHRPRHRLRATGLVLLAAGLSLGSVGTAHADAIVRSRAMLAGTIAEYHVEPGRVRLELEISAADLSAFPNLLPDELRAELGLESRPFEERIAEFFARDLVVSADGGGAAPGRILEIVPRLRVRRDEVTGEPLDPGPGSEPEHAVLARLEYAIPEKPGTLSFLGPRTPRPVSVGFVVYHHGVAVNDFRYLTASQTLELDWNDPWYSRFDRRALRRQYFAPMSAFLYVEPYEVRKEIIVRPLDLQRWVDLGLESSSGREGEREGEGKGEGEREEEREGEREGGPVLPAGRQAEVLRTIGEFLRDRQLVTIDGVTPTPELARVNFLERTLRTSRVVEPGADIDLYSAVVGAIFVYPTTGFPQEVTLEWDLWDDRIDRIPASSVDQAGPLPGILEPDLPLLVWNNFLKNPRIPGLAPVTAPTSPLLRTLSGWPGGAALVLLLAVLAVLRGRLGLPVWAIAVVVVAGIGAAVALQRAQMNEETARGIVEPLLTNVYHAFDYRDEERIYDTLARSSDGSVLETAYLETRKALELQSQGGARAKVESVELVDLGLEGVDAQTGDGFRAKVVWNVAGAVGHWGHVHQRRNQYEAWLGVAPREGAWKLVELDVVREERQ